MFELLRTWLNGPKKFTEGVVLYQSLIGSDAFFALLQKGETIFTRKKLDDVLLKKFLQLKSDLADQPVLVVPKNTYGSASLYEAPKKEHQTFAHTELYQACKADADLLYKEVMNNRALLFNMAKVEDFQDPNVGDKPRNRSQLALWVVINFNKASQLYEKAEFVKQQGHLPETDISSIDDEYKDLPEHLVKQTLDNLRKNINKIKKREQTPERIELLQKHYANLLKLEALWHSLKRI